jgi:hypothetical protein
VAVRGHIRFGQRGRGSRLKAYGLFDTQEENGSQRNLGVPSTSI